MLKTSLLNIPVDLNPTDYLNNLLNAPGKVVSSVTSDLTNITTDISGIASNNCILSNCSRSTQTTTTNNTTVQTTNGNNNNTSSTPTTTVTPTSSQPSLSPNIDLSGLLTLFSTAQNKSPGASQQPSPSALSDLTGIVPIAVIGVIAVLGIYMFTRK